MGVQVSSIPNVKRIVRECSKEALELASTDLERRLRSDSKMPRDTGRLARTIDVEPEGSDLIVSFRAPYAKYVNRSRRHRDFAQKAILRLWPRVARRVNRMVNRG